MDKIAGCSVKELIAENEHSLIHRAEDKEGKRVILKTLSPSSIDNMRIASFKREYKLISSVQSQLVVRPIRLGEHDNLPVMILEDIGGISLREYIKKGSEIKDKYDLAKALNLALLIVDGLSCIHNENIIHKDINPSNIIFNESTNQLNIIDFSRASKLSFERFELASLNTIEGTLPYISPEQTGRMNRQVDYRSDYYSLGISLYELFSLKLPFSAENRRAWVYSHTAKTATHLHLINPNIPEQVSAIVMKLMAKNAEHRYQSSYSLLKDLRFCLESIAHPEKLEKFELAKNDVSSRFKISQELYGRETELETLKKCIDESPFKSARSAFIKGEAGMGKSMLVGEIRQHILEKHGHFISGKFEQNKKNVPYYGIINAFSNHIQNILTESDAEIARLKQNLIANLNGNGKLITEIIPELEIIIGPQPEVSELSAHESSFRFKTTFLQFVYSFSKHQSLFAIFLDDLQWADLASIILILSIIISKEKHSILLIGSYRPFEAIPVSPLSSLFQTLNSLKPSPLEIELLGLKTEDIRELIINSLKLEHKEAHELARLCKTHTLGNPYFINEFLNDLHSENHIQFDSSKGKWICNHKDVKHSKMKENAVDFIGKKCNELDTTTQELIKIGSCLGNFFDTDLLSSISGIPVHEVIDSMENAAEQSIILPTNEKYVYSAFTGDATIKYKFVHDKVLQSSYSQLDDSEKVDIHLRIGRLLLKKTKEYKKEDVLFTILHHLNGRQAWLSKNEVVRLCYLNLEASSKAKASGAIADALNYAEKGILLVDEYLWTTQFRLAYSLYREAAELAYHTNDHNKIKKLVDYAYSRARTNLEKAELKEILILSYIAIHEQPKAIEEAFGALTLLGINIPKGWLAVNKVTVGLKTAWFKFKLQKGNLEKLMKMNESDNKEMNCASRIMSSIFSATFYVNGLYFPVFGIKIIELSLEHGLLPKTPVALISVAMAINNLPRANYRTTLAISSAGVEMLEKREWRQHSTQVYCLYNTCIRPWRHDMYEVSKKLKQTFLLGLETGDMEYGMASGVACNSYKFFSGVDLHELEQNLAEEISEHEIRNQKVHQSQFEVIHQTVKNLLETKEQPEVLHCTDFDEVHTIRLLLNAKDSPSALHLYLNKLMLAVIFNRTDSMDEIIKEGNKYAASTKTLLTYEEYLTYKALALLAIYDSASISKKLSIRYRISKILGQMEHWAKHSPSNFGARYYLVLAEKEKVFHNSIHAVKWYGKAIESAHKNKFVQFEALAHEMLARYWEENDCTLEARFQYQQAYTAYKKWGATAKLEDLESKLSDQQQFPVISSNPQNVNRPSQFTTYTSTSLADLDTIVDIATELSREKNFNALIEKVTTIVVEQAGAEKGVLLLVSKLTGEMKIDVSANLIKGEIEVNLKNEDFSDSNIASSVILKIMRTNQTEILTDAMKEGDHIRNVYIKKNRVKSILAFPLMKQSEMTGIVYLEHKSASNAFNKNQIRLLEMLSSLIAISIENANLYEKQEQIVESRTADLSRANEKLTISNKTKETFVSIISHDLKGPIGTLVNLMEDFESNDQNDPASYLDEMKELFVLARNQSKQNYNQLSSILEWARTQRDDINYTPETKNIHQIAETVKDLLGTSANAKKIKIENNIPETLEIVCDTNMTNTILRNFINNAIKYTFEGGLIQINCKIEQNEAIISVKDNGLGISASNLKKLFSIDNKQPSREGTKQEKGTGLGLIICKEFVERGMKGRIFADSEEGKGSTFTFTIPIQTLPAKQ